MAIKKTTYIIEVDTANGKVKIDGITKGFVNAELAAKKLNTTLATTSKKMGQTVDKTGLAGAAVVELGRTISDSNFGLTAMANNISQLSTLFVTLIATTGSLKKGLLAMKAAFLGPLGIIVIFQIVIAVMEHFAIEAKKTGKAVNDVAKAYRNAGTELELMLELDESLTERQRESIEERIKLLKEEAKVRAQIAQLQKLQGDLIEIEMKQLGDFVPWYQALWESVKSGDILSGGATRSQDFITSVMGLGEENKAKARKEIEDKIADLIASIDIDAVNRLTKDKIGKKREELKHTKGKSFGLVFDHLFDAEYKTDRQNLAAEELQAGQAFLNAELKLLGESQKRKDALRDDEIAADQMAFEHKMMLYDGIGQGLNALGVLMGEATQEGKAIAAAGALIDTYAAIAGVLKGAGKGPLGGVPGYAIAQAIGVGLFGFAQVKKIYDVKVPGGRGGVSGDTGDTGTTEIQPPNFNIVGGSGINQLRDVIIGELNKPNKVFITAKDVRTAAELDRNIVAGATVG